MDLLPSILRTFVPLAVGFLLSLPVMGWLGLTEDQLVSLVTVLTTAAYYLIVRLLEKVWPQAGWLLGYGKAPSYKSNDGGTA